MGSDDTRNEKPDWRRHGLRIIRCGELDSDTPQTPGMERTEAISRARVGRKNFGPGQCSCIRMPRPGHIITANLRR
jgi:uncharacterized RmlC-like cupin family protein